MATPYIKNDGVNYKIQAGLPLSGVATLQFTDSASSPVVAVPDLTGTVALTTTSNTANALALPTYQTKVQRLAGELAGARAESLR